MNAFGVPERIRTPDHLFQDVHKNCVFVGYDENQKPVFANPRGTNTEKNLWLML